MRLRDVLLNEKYKKMKGELAICGNPKCGKEFIKGRHNQNCCGNASCRTLYNRFKKGQASIPAHFNRSNVTARQPALAYNGGGSGFANNLTTSILHGAVAPTVTRAIGRGTFVGSVAASAFSGAVMPYLIGLVNSGSKVRFSAVDDEMNKWIREKEFWEKQRADIDRGILPVKSIGGFTIGALGGYFSVNTPSKKDLKDLGKKERKRLKKEIKRRKKAATTRALIGGVLLGGAGAYFEYNERQRLAMNGQALADNADAKILEAEHNIKRLREQKGIMEELVKNDVLVQDNNGVYSVNNSVADSIMSANDYKGMNIPLIHFKGAFKLLLSKGREKFYKLVGGLPEQGKSSYCVKFATYYAKNHGRVLYLPAEQSGDNLDFQDVLRRVNGEGFDIDKEAHTYNINQLLARIRGYDLIVLDSINDMNLSRADVKALNKKVAIMGVMQSTKAGGFKGEQGFLHDCDKFILIDKLAASASKSRGSDPKEERLSISIDKLTW